MGGGLTPVPEGGELVAKTAADRAGTMTMKVTKSEEAVFSLRPGKDAIVRLAAALQPCAPVLDFLGDGLQWRSTRRALATQAAFYFLVVYPSFIVPGLLAGVGLLTLTNKKNDAEGDDDSGEAAVKEKVKSYKARAKAIDVAWLQRVLESAATQVEHGTAIISWEDPVVSLAFVVACVAAAAVTLYVPLRVVVAAVGAYAMRPPSWRIVPGPLENLLNRMPDKAEEYARLTQAGAGAAAGA